MSKNKIPPVSKTCVKHACLKPFSCRRLLEWWAIPFGVHKIRNFASRYPKPEDRSHPTCKTKPIICPHTIATGYPFRRNGYPKLMSSRFLDFEKTGSSNIQTDVHSHHFRFSLIRSNWIRTPSKPCGTQASLWKNRLFSYSVNRVWPPFAYLVHFASNCL